MTGSEEHRELRELLGSYALGHLGDDETHRVRAHLDGCADCRAELESIGPAVEGLARVDLARLAAAPTPSPDLGNRIRGAVAAASGDGESSTAPAQMTRPGSGGPQDPRRRPGRAVWLLAAAALVLVAAVGGFAAGRSTAPQADAGPSEVIELQAVRGSDIEVSEATLVPHSWGVEVRFEATGFEDGEVYDAEVRQADGSVLPAGQFLGAGRTDVVCQMQSASPREESDLFVVTGADGQVVLRARLA